MALGHTGVIDVVEIRLTLCVDQEEPRRSQHGKRIAMVSRGRYKYKFERMGKSAAVSEICAHSIAVPEIAVPLSVYKLRAWRQCRCSLGNYITS